MSTRDKRKEREKNYLHANRVPPARPHLRKLIESLLSTYVYPNVTPPSSPLHGNDSSSEPVEWTSNILIPRISWSTRVKGAHIHLLYKFAKPNRISVEVYWDKQEKFAADVKFSILHTVPMDHKRSLKGLCAMAIAKEHNFKIPTNLSSKISATLYDYVVGCAEDMQDTAKRGTKWDDEDQPDWFSFSFRKPTVNFTVGSIQFFDSRDYVLDPGAYFLAPQHTERCICVDDKKPVADTKVYKGSCAPPDIMEESITAAPRVLSTLLVDPDTIFETTRQSVQKLTDHVISESVENLRFIVDIDLAYSGGGLGGVTVDLAKPSDTQRAQYIDSVKKNQETTISLFESVKESLSPQLKEIISLLYVLNDFALKNDDELFLFDRGINWEEKIEDPMYH